MNPGAETPPAARSFHPLIRFLRSIYLFEWLGLASAVALGTFLLAGPVRTQPAALALWLLRRIAVIALVSIALSIAVHIRRLIGAGTRWREELGTMEVARPSFWIDTVRILIAFTVIETSHLILKAYIPLINPDNHDALLGRIDSILFFGRDPLRLILDIFSAPLIHHAFDGLYSGVYFFALWAGVVVFFAYLPGRRRIAFFNGFFVMWQLGLVLYLLLPSWGPVFVHPEIFESTLADMPMTVSVQHGLFLETSSLVMGRLDVVIRFFGLAAFPSLHVAVFVLYSLWARRVGRIWLIWNATLVPLILIGSMLTGYHYLVDGLAGILVGASAWVIGRRSTADLDP